MTTTYIPKMDQLERKWYLIDASDLVLGKLAAAAAQILAGKNKPVYTPFLDTGDHVVVVNASKVAVSGAKESDKLYHHHSGYLGGMRTETLGEVRKKNSARIVEAAIRGMLPKTKLGRAMYLKLKVYANDTHPHQAQKPERINVKKK
jgi:large subunit ribosomal protein L13